jgi:hypothetical protein
MQAFIHHGGEFGGFADFFNSSLITNAAFQVSFSRHVNLIFGELTLAQHL